MKWFIIKILNLLYIPFVSKFIPKKTFFYAACGGGNMVLDMIIYGTIYNFILNKNDVVIFDFTISSAIASFLITFPIVFLTGLWLAKNITFTNSVNSNRKQSFRYLAVTITNIGIKYSGIKMLTTIAIWPSLANATMTVITVLFSYLMQNYYTFKGHKFNG